MTYRQILWKLLVDLWTDSPSSSLTLLRGHPDRNDIVSIHLIKWNAQFLCDLWTDSIKQLE